MSEPLALIDATIGRLRLGQTNEASRPELREWCGSLADDLEQALEQLKEPAPLLPIVPALAGGKWTPLEHHHGCWQAIREAELIGGRVQRFYDTAIDRLEGLDARRISVTFSSEFSCQLRCDELNRRQCIGGRSPNPPVAQVRGH